MTLAGVVLAVVISVHARGVAGTGDDLRSCWLGGLLTILPAGVAGAVLVDRRPDLPFGWLLGAAAVSQIVSLALVAPATFAVLDGDTSPAARLAIAVGSGLWFVPEGVKGIVNLRFPSGSLRSRRAAALQWAIVAGTALTLIGSALGASSLAPDPDDAASTQFGPLEHPLTGRSTVADLADGLLVFGPLTVALGLLAGIGVIVRWRRAQGIERQQLTWRVAGIVIAIGLFPVAVSTGVGAFARIDMPFFVLTLALPVLRYRLWSIDVIVRRSVAYGGVIALLLVLYAALAGTLAVLVSARVGAVVAAVVVAVAFAPLRDRARRLVDRWFYGDRSDPYRALSELGKRLETVAPAAVAPTIVETVAGSLRLPYAAIERRDGTVLAESGTPPAVVERWPLVFEGESVGQFVAAPRAGEEVLDGRDRALLGDVARQAGVAVHAAALTIDLMESRQQLVTAREEERRRLRRDLHDDLGPLLTAIGLNLDAARARLDQREAAADELIVDARTSTAQAIENLRELVHGLRPPALDELGLVGALQAQAARLERGSALRVAVDVEVPGDLPAAVEVAAFRTAVEAMHNSVRHGGARACVVRVGVQRCRLTLEVHDDGESAGEWKAGVGLAAMRERAEELGGTFAAGPRPGGGASVRSCFPLPEVRA